MSANKGIMYDLEVDTEIMKEMREAGPSKGIGLVVDRFQNILDDYRDLGSELDKMDSYFAAWIELYDHDRGAK